MAISARPPFPRPAAATQAETGFYPDEQAEFEAIVRKEYAEIGVDDARWLLSDGEIFIPPLHLRYFLPALAENARYIASDVLNSHYMENLVRIMRKAKWTDPVIAADLRRAVASGRLRGRDGGYVEVPADLDSFPAGHGFARLLHAILELDGDSAENRAFLSSDIPAAQLACIELIRGVIDGGWKFENAAASALFTPDAILERLERMKSSSEEIISLASRFLLGEVTQEDLPKCGDPDCPAHRRR